MPMVNVKITRKGATAEQKSQVTAKMTEVMARVLGKNPETTIVISKRWKPKTRALPACQSSNDAGRKSDQRLQARRNRYSVYDD